MSIGLNHISFSAWFTSLRVGSVDRWLLSRGPVGALFVFVAGAYLAAGLALVNSVVPSLYRPERFFHRRQVGIVEVVALRRRRERHHVARSVTHVIVSGVGLC